MISKSRSLCRLFLSIDLKLISMKNTISHKILYIYVRKHTIDRQVINIGYLLKSKPEKNIAFQQFMPHITGLCLNI